MIFKKLNSKLKYSLILSMLFFVGCDKEQFVADIAGEKLSQTEFKEVLAKHNGGLQAVDTISLAKQKEFLDLYIKFRMKVKEAYNRGYMNDAEVIQELNEYKRSLSVSYLVDKEIIMPAIKKMYDRSLIENRASHILITYAPEDTIEFYIKTEKIIDSLKQGVSFEDLAFRNSQDPTAQTTKGDLWYFTSGTMVQEFEDAIYNLPIGGLTEKPVRTQFGYHIIKLTDRKPSRGALRVSHIMKRFTPEATAKDSADGWKFLEEILDTINKSPNTNKNEIFASMATKYSEDTYSRDKSGDIGPIERRKTILEFDQVVFSLPLNTPSKVFSTPYGYHIAIVTSETPVPSFEEKKKELQELYSTYFYPAALSKQVALLKTKHNLQTGDVEIFSKLRAEIDSNATTANKDWDTSITKETRAKVIFSIRNENVTVDSMIAISKYIPELQAISFKDPAAFVTISNAVADKLILEFEARKIPALYGEFQTIIKEYEEGILLFKVEQNEVWNKVKSDSASLVNYYESTKQNYNFPDRVNIQEIFVANDSVASIVMDALKGYTTFDTVKTSKKLKKGEKVKFASREVEAISFDSAASIYNSRFNTKNQNGVYGLQETNTNKLTEVGWTMEVGANPNLVPFESGISIIRILQKDPARGKTFIEAITEVSSAYQEIETQRLSSEWHQSLKEKYKPIVNEKYFLNTK